MGTDIAGDGEPSSPPPLPVPDGLDDNGFPLPSSPTAATAATSFADDFYRSGTDWSSLLAAPSPPPSSEESGKNKSGDSLVQRSLFQAWGIDRRPRREEEVAGVAGGAGAGASSAPSGSWPGRKRRRGGEVEAAADRKPLACPFYKKIPGTPFTVDAFRYGAVEGCNAYFLSHFHHDHYGGLTKKWCHGPIYCTALTARLVKMCLSVNPEYICPLELDKEYVIEGVSVTLLEANHCPGAALIHFRLGDGKKYLHTGDFRASKSMQLYPLLQRGQINLLYLDTTYCNPKYKFPPKEDVIDFAVRTAKRYLQKEPKTLIVVGAYSIGKENVYLAISKALQVPIYTDASRRRILHAFGWSDLSKMICSDSQSSSLHVLPLSSLRHEKYLETLKQRFLAVLAFRPTGWTCSEETGNQLDLIKPSSRGKITIYGVPYSEHSSFSELREFVMFLRPQKVIPTVNVGNAASRDKMQAHFREWLKGFDTMIVPPVPKSEEQPRSSVNVKIVN
uniref:DNA repair metallo-beta-lactamase domain-containing protein n=1 Tax=Oryza nivara TaxID=4536 RepID=A0A0E0H080_ORYNI